MKPAVTRFDGEGGADEVGGFVGDGGGAVGEGIFGSQGPHRPSAAGLSGDGDRLGLRRQLFARRQRCSGREGVRRAAPEVVGVGGPGQGRQRQAQADGGVAGVHYKTLAPQHPQTADPHQPLWGGPLFDGEGVADGGVQPLGKDICQAGPLFGVLDLGVDDVDVDGEVPLLPGEVEGVFVGGHRVFDGDAEAFGQGLGELFGLKDGGAVRVGPRQPAFVLPDGFAVAAPQTVQGPPGQRLARVPLALAVLEQRPRREAMAQTRD